MLYPPPYEYEPPQHILFINQVHGYQKASTIFINKRLTSSYYRSTVNRSKPPLIEISETFVIEVHGLELHLNTNTNSDSCALEISTSSPLH